MADAMDDETKVAMDPSMVLEGVTLKDVGS
jgi:hypothetical protein